MNYNIAHIGLNVLDLEKSVRFYRDAFDMREVFRMYPKSDLDMILCFLSDESGSCMLALSWFGERKEPYELGENNNNIAIVTDDFEASYARHREMGIVCMEGIEKRIYYVEDPDGYQIAVVPEKFHPSFFVSGRDREESEKEKSQDKNGR